MDAQQFRDFGKAMVDFVADYNESLRERDVLPSVEPGYLSQMLPEEAPEDGETWQDVMKDIERVIMPGITHWNSPNFHAYFPTANSYPAIVGEILSAGLGVIGFSWVASPACTELEVVTMDWLGKLIGLPKKFLNCEEGPGGGVLQGSASETVLLCLLAARERSVRRVKTLHPEWDEGFIRSKLVAYSSDQSNTCVEKSGILGAMKMKLLPADEKCCLRGKTLLAAIEEDVKNGLIPSYVVVTLGTTGTCSFDNLNEIGPICNKYDIWLHVDAAYAGAAFICPEYRHLMSGINYADSFNFNPHKWLLVNFECSALWVNDSTKFTEVFNVDRIYLAYKKQEAAPDYRHWQISLGRRFRSIKLWFTLRLYGVTGLRNHIRHSIKMAKHFEEIIRSDDRFEIMPEPSMGLICFRLKGDNSLTQQLVDRITARKRIYVIRGLYQDKLIIRYAICSRYATEDDNHFAWNEIMCQAAEILQLAPADAVISNNTTRTGKDNGEMETRLRNLQFESKPNSQTIS